MVETLEVSDITQTTAACGGIAISHDTVEITEKGVCWSKSQLPMISDQHTIDGDGSGQFKSNLTGLDTNTLYFVRAYAKNIDGTGYGKQLSFTTAKEMTDIDGNVYHTVKIGEQEWMIENLRTTRLNDGTPIQLAEDSLTWGGAPMYCWYNYNPAYKNTYGALYNWSAVKTGKLAPKGWHVPGDRDWAILFYNLGGKEVAGGKMKEQGTVHWNPPNTGANNSSGFDALPGGMRSFNGKCNFMGLSCIFWSQPMESIDPKYWRILSYNSAIVGATTVRDSEISYMAVSVRCVKDE